MNPGAPFFTILTPTYNRAHTLGRVYRSLQAQTLRDFEWVIVDDGSIDRTPELVEQWVGESDVPIRYFRQPNAGKHVAFNRGVAMAKGDLCLALDSDDACVPQSLERLRMHWLAIPPEVRPAFAGIASPCFSEDGRVIGGPLPKEVIDGRPFEVLSRLRRRAEMWLLYRTDVLRAYPFPEFAGERFVPEGLVWNRIGLRFQMRFVNEPLRIYYDSADSLSRSSVRIRANSPRGTLACYGEGLALPVRLTLRLRCAVNLCRFAADSGRVTEALPFAKGHPMLVAAGVLPGLMLAWRDRRYLRQDAAM